MEYPGRKAKVMWFVVNACRIILALTFIFSGFVKAVDPWGMAIKIEEYLAAFGMEWLCGWSMGLAVWLNGAELMMGLMFLFNIRMRLISIFMSVAMTFFTVLTFVLAIWNPVEDCGCFGEAIQLTNWETFIKNLILLPMSYIVFWSARKKPIVPTVKDLCFMGLFATIAFGIGVYSYRHLPIIDFLPYKIGTDIPAAMSVSGSGDVETVVIYRDMQTGKEYEFALSDTTWYDSSRWEYVDTETLAINNSVHPSLRDFAIFDNRRLVTDEVLSDPGITYMVFASDINNIRPRCERKLEAAVRQAADRGYNIMCITANSLDAHPELSLSGTSVRCYNMDGTTIKTILRAKVGVVVLRKGVILDKVNCRDMLDKGELPQY